MRILTQLQVLGKVHPLVHADVAVGLEQHHGHRTTGLHVSNDELGNDVQADINVGRRLDNTQRQPPHNGNDKRDEKGPPAQVSGKTLSDAQCDTYHHQRHDRIPPERYGVEPRHQAAVDILFFLADTAEASPDVRAVEQTGVDEDGNDTSEGETVSQREGGRQEQGRVLGVLFRVKCELWGQDLADIVEAARVVVAVRVTDRQVLVVELARVVEGRSDNPKEDHHANQGVGNRVPGCNQRAEVETGDLGPVKGHGDEGKTRPTAKELIDHDVLRLDPGDPGEDTQERSNVAGDPVPAECAGHGVQEQTVTTDLPS